VGLLVQFLVPGTVSLESFGSIKHLYEHVASTVGQAEWGMVATTVPDVNRPTVMPIRAAFELRGDVDTARERAGLAPRLRHVPCALALAKAIGQVKGAIDPSIAMTLSLEVVFGMAKMVPMSQGAMRAQTET
jgi:hypothetical protein